MHALLANLLAADVLSGESRDLILERTEGNPFFVEEMIRSLIDAGFLVREDDGRRTVRPITTLDVPDRGPRGQAC